MAAELSAPPAALHLGRAARTLVRAASIGYGIGATIHADRLEDVHDVLRYRAVGLTDDELTYLGLIVVVRAERGPDGQVRRRVVAAHYARPVGRDEHGHVQRLPPAVVAARDERTDRLEHFAWGVHAGARRSGSAGGRASWSGSRRERARSSGRLAEDGVVDARSVRAGDRGGPS